MLLLLFFWDYPDSFYFRPSFGGTDTNGDRETRTASYSAECGAHAASSVSQGGKGAVYAHKKRPPWEDGENGGP